MIPQKIILVIPPPAGTSKEHLPSIGVGYLAAVLEKNDYKVEIIDSSVEGFDNASTVEEVLKKDPFLVGVSANTHNRFNALEIIKGVKSQSGGEIITVAGGPHFSPTAEQALAFIPELDVVVRNEGEKTLLQLANQLAKDKALKAENLRDIRGLSFKIGEEIVSTLPRDFIQDLDELPKPAWHLFKIKKYKATLEGFVRHRAIGVMSSRGCPHDCVFCCNSTFWQRRFRRHSPERFVRDVEFLYKEYGFRAFDFWDDTMTIVREHVEEICRQILERRLSIKWYARARVDTVDFELLSLMKEAGCKTVSFGVESGSERILKVINKKINLKQTRRVAEYCEKLGLVTKFFFVYSLPQEDEGDLNLTLDLVDELSAMSPRFHCYGGIAKIYPGTQLEALAKKEGKLAADFNWYRKVHFGLNEEVGSDPTVPIYENANLPAKTIAAAKKQRKKERVKQKDLLELVKKGVGLLFGTRRVADIKILLKNFIEFRLK